MIKMYKPLALCLSFLAAFSWNASAQTTYTFPCGAHSTWIVPPGVTSVLVDVQGASGGFNSYEWFFGLPYVVDSPGHGARVQATLTVVPGATLDIYVGGAGGAGVTGGSALGGYNGGGTSHHAPGAAITANICGGGGGGASDIRIGGTALTNRVVVAGGGGGAGSNYVQFSWPSTYNYDKGGDGGGTTAEAGWDGLIVGGALAGGGGTGGGGGSGSGTGTPGTLGLGGNGALVDAGGGGGGGYYGGGGADWAGGGGGSSYTDPVLCTGVTHTRGFNTAGCGSVSITVLCSPPVGGTIVGPSTVCTGSTIALTDPTGTGGGVWTSSNTSIATVGSSTGIVTGGTTTGPVTITYSIVLPCGSATATKVITVNPAPGPITVPTPVCMGTGVSLTDTSLGGTWSSSVPSVGTIDPSTGFFVPISPGTTTVSYGAPGCASTVVVTVNPTPAAIVGPSVVCQHQTISLSDPTLGGTWSSTVPAAASVDAFGTVTGVGPGGSATNVLYTLPGGCFAFHFVSVSSPPVIITGPTHVCQGNAILLYEPVGPGVGTWTSSPSTVATVVPGGLGGAYGVVTGLLSGSVTVTYTMPACPPTTYVVTVNPLPSPIMGSTAICTGLTTTLVDTTAGGSWSSSTSSITVGTGGTVTSTSVGVSGTISYTLPTGCYRTIMVNVNTPPAAITGGDSVCQGSTVTLGCATPGGIWSSTNLAIAPVIDSTGVVTGVAYGGVNISYTLPSGCFSMEPFIVKPPVDPTVSVSYAPTGLICEGTPMTFTAVPVNGGTPTYVWEKFSVPLGGIDSAGILHYTPTHGDAIMVIMMPHGVCSAQDTVIDTFVVNVYPHNVQPAVTITCSSPDTMYMVGQIFTFFSNVTWGGTAPTYQWYMNRVAIAGATASSYTTPVYASDTFFCKVTGNPPCEDSTPPPGLSNPIIIHDYLGIGTVSGSNLLSLFPNPNNGSFVLSGTLAGPSVNAVRYEVTNMLGQVVYRGETIPQNGKIYQQMNMGDLAMGSYLLRINTDTGNETFHFVISK